MIKVLFIGQYDSPSGYSKAFRDFVLAYDMVEHNDIDLKIFNFKLDSQYTEDSRLEKVLPKYLLSDPELPTYVENNRNEYICIMYLPTYMYALPHSKALKEIAKQSAYSINMTLWEADKVPSDWIKAAQEGYVKHMIANCSWNCDMFENDFNLPCEYLPCVVDTSKDISNKKLKLAPDDVFKILSVSTLNHRKGFDILIKAYVAEFDGQEDVKLFIKTYVGDFSETDKKMCRDYVTKYKNDILFGTITEGYRKSSLPISLMLDKLSVDDMNALYNSVDLFALFSRGEGFGLPYTEALIRGVPVACPNKGGHMDFCKKEFTFQADCKLQTCSNYSHWYTADLKQYETDIDDARRVLRNAYNLWKNNRKAYDVLGNYAKAFMDNDNSIFSYRLVGEKFVTLIKQFNDITNSNGGEIVE